MSRTRYLQSDEPHIEIIPMIDIMMFLLIFFMVTMLKMIDVSGLKINVPQAASAATLPSKSLTIVVDKTGAMFFEGKPVEHDALVDQLKERARTAKLEVLVAGDKDVSLENLLHVMDVARAAGVEDIGIAAKH
ncbi:biopolymer transporter ExbD [Herbaspirillum huttiense]|jgi:biopolymer transport protein ExbD|uniref:Biopolymer transporter ExbD n=3 Tax=Pseudomonadota TaxID=1224 RepID=A0AAJ2HBF3_9BURK|nr:MULTISPECIES: biopolymer transporter ExbD [Herbaspirillum]MAF01379.1 biopolymer transporter ExbD [Herbaspirillum sp.]MBN9355340.1 biopolymer transporter ExbD [Herbaspirillum huttiense]MBO18768.1 biopolymer transporter ExbD [Herbaspirillum sp.]MDR9838988.1 biopolymer transporter ExbD [Herbaspirillum huttiense]QBP76029.1 biopolymer transporter ExbD [Herbaspirillum huttiense]|tara:strand:- start:66 stop:464 length:399 start_codon:yes stop_codon:yes gene_type:complete